ncbi:MAG: T9SS type A sorting domain-containing protein [Flavobacteriales bacterium]|nr:T9SS type A sorting domain-containing protein [Flavobacteriales bacterium]
MIKHLTLSATLAFASGLDAQVVFNEEFTATGSTTGFTMEQIAGNCHWFYGNPDWKTITGAGFDADFAIFDMDYCGEPAIFSSEAALVSPEFDASTGNLILSFSQQYRTTGATTANVEVWDGSQWNIVYSPTAIGDVGYPNPAVSTTVNITGAAGGAQDAKVRFRYRGFWEWWWALDNIQLERVECTFPADLAISGLTPESATISWTDNGSNAYQWVITLGGQPDGSDTIASGIGNNFDITGLESSTPYTAFVRADCDGIFSTWNDGLSFTTPPINDDCDAATNLPVNPDYSCNLTVGGNITGATSSGPVLCTYLADDDVWYSFTATGNTHRVRLLNVTGVDPNNVYLKVFGGSCGGLTVEPDGCSPFQNKVVAGFVPAETYFVQVFSLDNVPGHNNTFDLCIGTPVNAGGYCATYDVTTTIKPICNVTFGGIDNDSPGSGNMGPALEDFTDQTANVTAGSIYPISISATGSFIVYNAYAFFDWDQDSIFEASVNIGQYSGNSCSQAVTTNVIVPANAVPGTSRMRVVNFPVGQTPAPCGVFNFGQAEDYSVFVQDLGCPAPENVTISNIYPTSANINWTYNGSSYEWVVTLGDQPDGTNTIASGNGFNTNITGLESSTSYAAFVRANCDGELSAWSNPEAFTTIFDNDECEDAFPLTVNPDYACGTITASTFAGATPSVLPSSCFGFTVIQDVWFSFTATSSTHVVKLLNISGLTGMTVTLWEGICGNLSLAPNGCALGMITTFPDLNVGTTYYLQASLLSTAGGQPVTFDICVGLPAVTPANDDCAGAIEVPVNMTADCVATAQGDLFGSTQSNNTNPCIGLADDDVWFSFMATAETLVVELNITGPPLYLNMALWEGACGNLTLVPDGCQSQTPARFEGLNIGTTYYLQVYSYSDNPAVTTTFDVCVRVPATPPVNDDCAGAIAVPVNNDLDCAQTVPGTFVGATASNSNSTCNGNVQDDTWFSFVATNPEHRITLTNITPDLSIYRALWTGDCDNLNLVPGSCNGNGNGFLNLSNLTPGTTYFLQVYSDGYYGELTNTFDVCIGTPPPDDGYCHTLNFENAVEPICNVTFAGINNDSPSAINGSPSLENFTNISAVVTAGNTYPISVTGNTETGPARVTVFFDWDQDHVFETAIHVGSFNNNACATVIMTDIQVPANALVGTSHMRVVKKYLAYPSDPCANDYGWGQGEDYTVTVSQPDLGYCNDLSFTDVYPICKVSFANIDNSSSSNVNGSPALEDFTDLTANLTAGSSYPIFVTASADPNDGVNPYYVSAFFDWDLDSVFETMVEIGNLTGSVCDTLLITEVNVPTNALNGIGRMRVVNSKGGYATDPCASYMNGQGEDYTVHVDMSIGIAGSTANGIALMPNPANDRITLTNPNGKATQAMVYEMVGNLVLKTATVEAINITSLNTGSYILVAQNSAGENLAHLRFVKQ